MSELVKMSVKPSFITDDEPKGIEELSQVIQPSRLKIIQPLIQDEELSANFSEGDVVLVPEKSLVYAFDQAEPVQFTPILFYREWCIWNPLKMQGQLPFIRDSTRNPNTDLAKRCSDPELRQEPCPENPKENLRYMAHLNYLVLLRMEGAPAIPMLMTFASAEYKNGQRFANLVVARNSPIYAGNYQFTISKRSNDAGKWYGFNVSNAIEPWVDQEEYDLFKSLHKDLSTKLEEGNVRANYEDSINLDNTPQEEYKEFSETI